MHMNQGNATRRGELSIECLERTARILRMLAHPHRLKIVEMLESRKEAPVFELVRGVGLSQSKTSQHLALMRRAGIVAAHRRGKEVWYSIGDRRSLAILDCCRKNQGGRLSWLGCEA
jgi:ArsR family transcriptional regulator, zinc-responsive transcriptional repressor